MMHACSRSVKSNYYQAKVAVSSRCIFSPDVFLPQVPFYLFKKANFIILTRLGINKQENCPELYYVIAAVDVLRFMMAAKFCRQIESGGVSGIAAHQQERGAIGSF